jgi:hypothetical protein
MLSLRARSTAENPPAFRDRALSGLIGAGIVLGALMLSNGAGQASAIASEQQAGDEPRGLVSAIEQRRMIIQRLDRLIATLERIEGKLPDAEPAQHKASTR